MGERIQNMQSFYLKSKRVWHVLRKPTMDEFKMVTKISAIGILVIGLLGFVISLAMGLFDV
jgi:protein transport protein SEC61 subunit gamma-like protein